MKKVKKGESKRELWYKIKISRTSLTLLIIFFIVMIALVILIYFDKIGLVIKWRIDKLELHAAELIDQSRDFGAKVTEIERFENKLNLIESQRQSASSVIEYRNDLNDFITEIEGFIQNLQLYNKGYLAKMVRVVRDVTVDIGRSLSWSTAERGLLLNSGDRVKTGIESLAELKTDSGNILRVNPESMIIIKDLSRDRNTFAPKEVYSMKHSPNSDFRITTRNTNVTLEDNNATINVTRQTDVAVKKNDEQATISVMTGLVQVKNNKGEMKEVRTRQALSISEKGVFDDMIEIPLPPELLEPLNLKFFRFAGAADVEIVLSWNNRSNVNKFGIQVAQDIDFQNIIIEEKLSTTSYRLQNLESGNYFWRISCYSARSEDIQSEYSPAYSFLITFDADHVSDDITPPSFTSLSVKPISKEAVLIEGKTEPGARLYADSININITDDGSFRDIIPVEVRSKKSIELKLYDTAGNIYRRKVSLY